MQVGLPDKIVDVGDVSWSSGASLRKGTLLMSLLHKLTRLLDHYNAVIDQVAELDNLFGLHHW